MQESNPEEITKVWSKVIKNELERQEEEKSDNEKWLTQNHPKVYELIIHESSKTLVLVLNLLEKLNNEKTR